MSIETQTLRERLRPELATFERIDVAVFTTYSFVPDFFEQNVLTTLFGVESGSRTARRVQVNAHLDSTPVAVFYDMGTQPRGGGEFRYQHLPVRLDKGGVFHPKLTIVGGQSTEGELEVLVAVSSANLTLKAWGHNDEVVGTFWVSTEAQRDELQELIRFLKRRAIRAAAADKGADATTEVEALVALEQTLANLEGLATNPKGYPKFRCFGLRRSDEPRPASLVTPGRTYWETLTVFSPYWSNQEDTLALAKGFRARECGLVPAPKATGTQVCLGIDDDTVGEYRVDEASFVRFRHAKLYVAEGRFRRKKRARVTLGSANFTLAALGQSGAAPINVEALVAYEIRPVDVGRVIPPLTNLAEDVTVESDGISEEDDTRLPFSIYVAFDWPTRQYRIALRDVKRARDFRIVLPGSGEHRVAKGFTTIDSATGPMMTREFSISFRRSKDTEERETVRGLITEFGLDDSDHQYTPALKLDQFFVSWQRRNATAVFDLGPEGEPEGEQMEETVLLPMTHVPVDQLDATNLFEIYRAMARLEKEHLRPALEEKRLGVVREYLVARPDSVARFAGILAKQTTQLGVRLALLIECARVFEDYTPKRTDDRTSAAAKRVTDALADARKDVLRELRDSDRVGASAKKTLRWFEAKLREAW